MRTLQVPRRRQLPAYYDADKAPFVTVFFRFSPLVWPEICDNRRNLRTEESCR